MIEQIKRIDVRKKQGLLIGLFFLLIPYLFYFNLLYADGVWAVGDATILYIPWYKYFGEMIREGNITAWADGISLGIPFIESMPISIFYPFNWLVAILDFEFFYNSFILLHFSLAGIFTYKYLRELGYNRKIAILGGIVYMFSGAIASRRNHVNVLYNIIWFPLIMYFYEKMSKKSEFRYIIYFAAALAILIYAGAMQHYLYVAIVVAIYFLFKLFNNTNKKEWIIKNIISVSISIIISLPIIIMMYSVMVGSAKDIQDYNHFTSYSLYFKNLVTFIFPNIFGTHIPNTPLPLYGYNYQGGGNLTEYGLYVGILPFLSGLYVLFKEWKKDRNVQLWGTIFLVSLVLALGGSIPFISKIMFEIPMYNLFRVPSRWLFITDFALVILFSKFLDGDLTDELKKFVKYYLGICFIFVWSIGIVCVLNNNEGIIIESLKNIKFTNANVWLPMALMLLYYMWIKWTQNRSTKFITKSMYIGLVILVGMDLWSYSFFHENVLAEPEKNNEVAVYLNEINTQNNRVWPILSKTDALLGGTGVNYNLYNGIRTINGYYGLLSDAMQSKLGFDSRGTNIAKNTLLFNPELLGKLDVRYLVVDKQDMATVNSLRKSDKKLIFEDQKINFELINDTLRIYQKNINIVPNTNYNIIIELKDMNEEQATLHIDLYGQDYDSIDQEIIATPQGLELQGVVNSGAYVPEEVFVRVFSFDKGVPEINSIKIYEQLNTTDEYLYNVIYDDAKYMVFDIGDEYIKNKLFLEDDNNLFTHEINTNDQLIEELKYKSGNILAKVNLANEGNLIFNESYNKGWKGYIDGVEQEVIPVNELVLGMKVPAGDHIIEFKYQPYTLKLVISIYIVGTIYIIGCYSIYRVKGHARYKKGNY